jgi:hypothetical protein
MDKIQIRKKKRQIYVRELFFATGAAGSGHPGGFFVVRRYFDSTLFS